ncbi:MAG TPA: class I SAM-dependent methyltransferase [Rhodopila sp.]|uniref:class I SAM-dependent methyltransferase n=1 Tax=Rhodopila sp. TaxID=2480087 RepID=UPI002BABFC07|nr:class I SAM-dependent methyltransferase [Rhodopila sp.]HVY15049.1 class I SAM-dependent methyltransferase [Rhodopila sp.]
MLSSLIAPPLFGDVPHGAAEPSCRLCGARLHQSLLDLGRVPLSNRTVTADEPDQSFPLHARICESCMLVQIPDVAAPAVLTPPAPFLSSRSPTAVEHARRFAETMCHRLSLDADSLVIEIGSNDGYLLRHFQAASVPVLGIEAAATPASVANELGVPTETGYFCAETAMEIAVRHGRADLVVANNVLPHVPDLFDFAAGFAGILRPNGVLVLEVPHLQSLVQRLQFDAFRHDTYAYLSLQVVERILRSVALRVFDAERLTDHGGSLRIYACHAVSTHGARPGLKAVRQAEANARLHQQDFYADFNDRVATAREEVSRFIRLRAEAGRRVVAYGAAARGATLLNLCGVTANEIACVADADPDKQGRLLPGSRVPVVSCETLLDDPPDDLFILPWTHMAEISSRMQPLRQTGTQFWAAIPRLARV